MPRMGEFWNTDHEDETLISIETLNTAPATKCSAKTTELPKTVVFAYEKGSGFVSYCSPIFKEISQIHDGGLMRMGHLDHNIIRTNFALTGFYCDLQPKIPSTRTGREFLAKKINDEPEPYKTKLRQYFNKGLAFEFACIDFRNGIRHEFS